MRDLNKTTDTENKTANINLFGKIKSWWKGLKTFDKILFIFLIINVCIMIDFMFFGILNEFYFSGDTVTTNFLVREQRIEGRFFPQNWFYAQDFWIQHLNIPTLILSFFIKDQALLRSATSVFVAILLFFILYLLVAKKFKSKSFFLLISMLFTFVSSIQMDAFFGQAAYAVLVIILIVQFCMWCAAFEEDGKINKKKLVIAVIYLAFSSVVGPRYFSFFVMPMVLTMIVESTLNNFKDNDNFLKNIFGLCKKIFLISISAGVGIVIFSFLSSELKFSKGLSGMNLAELGGIQDFKILIIKFLEVFGYETSVLIPLISTETVFIFIKIAVNVFTVLVFPTLLLFKFKNLKNIFVKRFLLFSVFSFLIGVAIFLFSHQGQAIRYLQPSILFLQICGIYYIYEYHLKKFKWNQALSLAVVFMMTFSSINSVYISHKNGIAALEHRKEVVQEIVDSGYKYGFADYWLALPLTATSNFDVEIVPTLPNFRFPVNPMNFLSSLRISQDDFRPADEPSFVLLTEAQFEEFNSYYANNPAMEFFYTEPDEILRIKEYYLLGYDYNICRDSLMNGVSSIEKSYLKSFYANYLNNNSDNILEYSESPEEIRWIPNDTTAGMAIRGFGEIFKGDYILTINVSRPVSIVLKFWAGEVVLEEALLMQGENVLSFSIEEENVPDLEFYLFDIEGGDIDREFILSQFSIVREDEED